MSAVTKATPRVGVVSPGQMGAAIAGQIRAAGHTVLWSAAGRSQATRRRAEAVSLTESRDLATLCQRADVILSICPPADAEEVAAGVAAHGFSGIYVEANAISPTRYVGIKELLPDARAVLDGSIIGPPPSDEKETTLYLAGPERETDVVAGLFSGSKVRVKILPHDPPAASALKMAYAGYQKATRALAAVAHALADQYQVTEHLIDEAERNSRSPLADPGYIPSVAARAWRWAPELRDVAQTLADNGLPSDQAQAAARVLERWSDAKDNVRLAPGEALALLRDRDRSRPD
jgi:3-hydroxyisobutyrate dehydrogenase-like beta-hydroxyacid dehydrogenase